MTFITFDGLMIDINSAVRKNSCMDQRARAASSRRAAELIALAAALTTVTTLFAPTSMAAEGATPVASRPNVVVVVADDVGFSDLGAYGSEIRTPHIDAIASRGVMFSNFHVSPMCSPSRAMLLTGVDAHLAGVASLYVATPLRHRGRPGYEGELRTDVVTVASRLRDAGYRTYLSGKWNLGHTPTSLPSARGFDRTFALDSTGADNFEKKPYLPIYGEPPWFADGKPTDLPDDFYSSEHLVDKLVEFIAADRTSATQPRPFFAYLAFQAVHLPVQAPREFIERYEGVYDEGWDALRRARHLGAVESGVFPPTAAPSDTPAQADWAALAPDEKAFAAKNMAVNAAMLEAMDHHFGRFVDYLDGTDLLANTVFVVLSDNGPEAGDPAASATFDAWAEDVGYRRDLATLGERGSYAIIGPHFARAAAAPLAYYKFHGGEGGIRVPLIIAGPGVEARGVSPAFTYATDIAPTLLELTGTSGATPSGKHPISGRSLAPALRNLGVDIHPPDAAIGFETAGNAGVFKGDHKLVRVGAPDGDRQWRLFDLAEDPGETRDLAVEQPQRLAQMLADYEAYAARVGVLEVPAAYSPTRQLLINYLYDRAKANLHLVIAGAGLVVVLFGLAVWLIRRRRPQRPPTHLPQE
ncbi:MAG: sulfatase-like hydrolase/transferase [Gammaproteobacteria bacterium]|nr:sulfatase-like hydrolase/transferase [Gammaproteobacteria bacterium]